MNKLLALVILFSSADNAVFVAKLLRSGILSSNSVSLVFLKMSVTSGIFFSDSALSACYLVFKTKPLVSILLTFVASLPQTFFFLTSFFTTLFNLVKSTGIVVNLLTSNLLT